MKIVTRAKSGAEAQAAYLAELTKVTKRMDALWEKRMTLIQEASISGATVVGIAKAAGVTRQQMHRILFDIRAAREAMWAEMTAGYEITTENDDN